MNKEKESLLIANHVKKYFPMKNFFGLKSGDLKAVDGVSLEIYKGETLGLVGESGCGKSTLGRLLIGMLAPTEGSILYKGKGFAELDKMGERNQRQIIFQDPYSSLNPHWNVQEILEEPLKQVGVSAGERKERVAYILERVGLHKGDLEKFSYEFSGGQRQRIGIARALMTKPEFILCDEPIAALDVSIQAQVVNMLEDLQREFGLTYLFAAHDLSMVKYISTRIAVMYLGSIVELTTSKELYEVPLHPYTQALLSAIPVADPVKARQKKRIELRGELPKPTDKIQGCAFAKRCPRATEECFHLKPELVEIRSGHHVACHHV